MAGGGSKAGERRPGLGQRVNGDYDPHAWAAYDPHTW